MTKISELDPAAGLTGGEVVPIVQTGATRKVSIDDLSDFFNTLLPANLVALAGLSGSSNTLPYFTGSGALSLTTLSAAARSVLDESTTALMLAAMNGAVGDGAGDALKALVLSNPRTINGVSFNGSANILVSGSRVAFSATKEAGTPQTIPSATLTKVTFQTELTDVGAGFDLPNSRFVAPVAGNYAVQFGMSIISTTATDVVTAQLYKNGARIQNGQPGSSPLTGGGISSTGAATLPLAASDVLEVYVFSSGTGTRDSNTNPGNAYLAGFLL